MKFICGEKSDVSAGIYQRLRTKSSLASFPVRIFEIEHVSSLSDFFCGSIYVIEVAALKLSNFTADNLKRSF